MALVDDRNRAPLTVGLDALAAARARVGSYKHRLLVLDAPAAELLGTPALGRAAGAYREAAARWGEVAGVALPAGAGPFAEARRLTDQLQAQVERGDAGRGQAAALAALAGALAS